MNPLTLSDISSLQDYELERPTFRSRVIEVKRRRRIGLGPLVTLVFENRDTVRFQVQEMVRIERIARPEKIQEEIDVYNALLPGEGEVAATLFIEVTDFAMIRQTLDGFLGLDEPGRLLLEIGGEAFPALFAAGQSREDRISAVHFVRFPLGERGKALLASGAPARLRVAHGDYRATADLSPENVEELLADLP